MMLTDISTGKTKVSLSASGDDDAYTATISLA
jgi:hypothetical protein